jgi:hypothetical protein
MSRETDISQGFTFGVDGSVNDSIYYLIHICVTSKNPTQVFPRRERAEQRNSAFADQAISPKQNGKLHF